MLRTLFSRELTEVKTITIEMVGFKKNVGRDQRIANLVGDPLFTETGTE